MMGFFGWFKWTEIERAPTTRTTGGGPHATRLLMVRYYRWGTMVKKRGLIDAASCGKEERSQKMQRQEIVGCMLAVRMAGC